MPLQRNAAVAPSEQGLWVSHTLFFSGQLAIPRGAGNPSWLVSCSACRPWHASKKRDPTCAFIHGKYPTISELRRPPSIERVAVVLSCLVR